MDNTFCGFIFLILHSGYSITINAQGCDPMSKVCEKGQSFECDPYYYKQVVPQPKRESPIPYNTDDDNGTSITTISTSTTETTPTPTTTAAPDVTTEIPTFVICVSQCDPGWYGDPENKTCEKCSVEKCAMCSESGSVCLVCMNGWDLQGNKCKQFSPAEIALIALTSIFGFVILVMVIIAIVFAARNGCFNGCFSCPCGPCKRPVTSRRHSISAPGKDELGIHAVKKVERTSTASKRYTREPTQKREQSLTMAEDKSDPMYPESYTTPINGVGSEVQEDYEGYDDTPHQSAVTDEYYDDVESPGNGDGIPARTTNETTKKKRGPFFKKKSKENEKDQNPPKTLTQQVATQQAAVSQLAMVFRKEPPKVGSLKKVRQPSPVPRINNNDVDEEYYNDVAPPSEYSDTEMPGGDPQPLYENVEEMRQGISGTNNPSQKGREGQQAVYGNVDPAISYANVEEDVQRPIRGRRTNKRVSKC